MDKAERDTWIRDTVGSYNAVTKLPGTDNLDGHLNCLVSIRLAFDKDALVQRKVWWVSVTTSTRWL